MLAKIIEKRIWIPLTLIIIITTALIFFQKNPIVKDINNCTINWIRVNVDDDMIEIKNFNEEEVIKFLSTCYKRRTIDMASSFSYRLVKYEIVLRENGKLIDMVLGDINQCTGGRGTFINKIINPDEVILEFEKVLKIEQ